ncbi:O-antigen ligase family protein [Pseudarthrobacter sp. P1]|uniref:O-antigen ligase family protein n=1 Tax=Pseudarthrobacter sp. P1 TaxID=3418418 RepID=UPI003CE95698
MSESSLENKYKNRFDKKLRAEIINPLSAKPRLLASKSVGSIRGPFTARLSLIVVLIGSSGAFQVFIPSGGGSTFALAPLIIASWLMVTHFMSPTYSRVANWLNAAPLVLLCAMPVLSFIWSIDGRKTINVAVVLIIFGILAMAVSRDLTLEQRISTASKTLGFLIFVSLVTVVLLPQYGIDHDDRAIAWRGIFLNKNSFGRVAAIELLFCIFLSMKSTGKARLGWLTVAASCSWIMFQSDSQTAFVAATLATVATFIVSFSKLKIKFPRIFSLAWLSGYLFVSISIPIVGPIAAQYVSRDPTLTGRTVLWDLVDEFSNQRPTLGWGFGTVWQTDGGIGNIISTALTFIPGSAHNGLLDLRIQIGYIGIVSVMLGLWLIFYRAIKFGSNDGRLPWIIGYATLYFVMDLTESTLFFGLTWFLMWILFCPDRATVRNDL